MICIPQRSKSAGLRVARAAPCDCAMAAIMASNCEIGRPAAPHPATILAKARAAFSFKGRTLASNCPANIFLLARLNEQPRSLPIRPTASWEDLKWLDITVNDVSSGHIFGDVHRLAVENG